METELTTVASQVMSATDYLDVFGSCDGDADAQTRHVKQVYRHLAHVLHPDHYPDPTDRAMAEETFAQLGALHAQAQQAITDGVYGQPVTLATVRTKQGEHVIIRSLGTGDLCTLYWARSQVDGAEVPTLCKIAGNSGNNDLLQAEAQVLRHLRADGTDPQLHVYVPELVDTFTTQEKRKSRRAANIIGYLDGFYTLEQVMAAYPGGLHPLDMAWMWRRLLVAIDYAHLMGVIHGAVLPPHVMIHSEMHGLVLVDWCYSQTADTSGKVPAIKAVVDRYREWYPEEVFAKQMPSPATDIAMAARCMVALMGGDPPTGNLPDSVPQPMRAFFRGCLATRQTARPSDAWALLQEFDALLEHLGKPYFPRHFRPFAMPYIVA